MKKYSYKVLNDGIANTNEAKIGKDVFYKCAICLSILPSSSKDNVSCSCGNIGIDKDLHRLFVKDYTKFVVLEKTAENVE
jgi:hypothetical protein